jgi:hypothetical protein
MIFYKYTKPGEKLQKSMPRAEIKDENKSKMGEKAFTPNLPIVERDFTNNVGGKYGSNKRDTISTRMNERKLIVQSNGNPFLSQNNYINDLMNQEKYIRQNNNINRNE